MKGSRGRRPAFAVILSLSVFGLGGCALVEEAQKLVPTEEPVYEETTLVVHEDGTLTETIIDKLEQSYYDADELKGLIDDTVSSYNNENGTDCVTVDHFTVEEGSIELQMTYQDAAAYASYNNEAAFNGSMLEAQMAGFAFLNDFRRVNGGASEDEVIANEEPLSHKEYQVLVTDLSHAVQVPGKVHYISANAKTQEGSTLVYPLSEEELNGGVSQGLELPSSAVFVEEKAAGTLSEADLEKTYLYIIYE